MRKIKKIFITALLLILVPFALWELWGSRAHSDGPTEISYQSGNSTVVVQDPSEMKDVKKEWPNYTYDESRFDEIGLKDVSEWPKLSKEDKYTIAYGALDFFQRHSDEPINITPEQVIKCFDTESTSIPGDKIMSILTMCSPQRMKDYGYIR